MRPSTSGPCGDALIVRVLNCKALMLLTAGFFATLQEQQNRMQVIQFGKTPVTPSKVLDDSGPQVRAVMSHSPHTSLPDRREDQ